MHEKKQQPKSLVFILIYYLIYEALNSMLPD